ncbi:LuxR family transcriptional regulator [Amycolatopsis balhimycina DSM 5908]|uniref:LuxR family transcriptional regulator n=1 Tax=Amycolatopsis balhimycina DSM 5908 TaxID=1081091 RepID=A0A428WV34_AMYBA|nr:BTAD domain-containing putative transcriptional regulator [Amycolatopsis balhimycina]RSM46967.1 LuxR family transcriptional regulator [Amycolatopsis balhimycina DSM 5908]
MTIELVLLPRVSYRGREITSPRLGGLLALLAGDLRTGASTARLIEGLWPDERPEHPAKALQVLVSRARAQLGHDVIEATSSGYRLTLAEDQVDTCALVLSATACARLSRDGDHEAALAHAEAGLALWTAQDDPGSADPLGALRTARASTSRWLLRARALCRSRLGRAAEAADELAELVAERPRDEELLLELLRSEAATAGPAAALARYEDYRRGVRDELGSDPGPALRELHQRLLQGEAPAVRHGVAHEPNPLLGRDADLAAVTGLLRTSRVTSIVGAGGLGKTRLAHAVSRRADQRIVHFVPLAGITHDDEVAAEVASAVGGADAGGPPGSLPAAPRDAVTGILDALGSGPALLVLDNCEHVVRGVADLVRTLVALSADLRVLTTGRTPLDLSSEAVHALPELSPATAAELFRQRASAVRPDIDLPGDTVRELCAHLDGLPLAIELAAARARVMSVPEIARHLDDRFALLRGGARDAPARHRTLHAVIDWSWNLLDRPGQAAMRALSVFPGGFTADAARHLLGDEAVDLLDQLAGHSLLKVLETPAGTRFRMLETVREFSAARRDEAGETEKNTAGFLAWAVDFSLAHHESLFGADLVPAMRRVGAEHDNLVHALRHGIDHEDGTTVAATSAALAGLWTFESNFGRMAALVADTAWLLSHYRPEPRLVAATRTSLVLSAVNSFLLQGPRPTRSLVALRRLPPAAPGTLVHATETVIRTVAAPDFALLFALCGDDDPLVAGLAEGVASYAWSALDDPGRALAAAERMVAVFDGRDSPWLRAVAHARVGELCLELERGEEARRSISTVLAVLDETGTWPGAARIRGALVLANLQTGAIDEAEHWLEQAMLTGGSEVAGASMVDVGARAEILLARGDVDAGLRLWRQAAERLRSAKDTGPGADGWMWETQAVTVVAHACHGRLDLVTEITGDLPRVLPGLLEDPGTSVPVCGALLLALALADLDRAQTAGERSAAVRMIALADRFRYVRGFHPTMSSARIRALAEQAAEPAYTDARSEYAGLGREELRAAAIAALAVRPRDRA